jgi:hypothetical protein
MISSKIIMSLAKKVRLSAWIMVKNGIAGSLPGSLKKELPSADGTKSFS